MKERRYTVILDPDPATGSYTVTVSALPGIITQGSTLEDAIATAREAIKFHIEGLIAGGEPVPEETEPVQTIIVKLTV